MYDPEEQDSLFDEAEVADHKAEFLVNWPADVPKPHNATLIEMVHLKAQNEGKKLHEPAPVKTKLNMDHTGLPQNEIFNVCFEVLRFRLTFVTNLNLRLLYLVGGSTRSGEII